MAPSRLHLPFGTAGTFPARDTPDTGPRVPTCKFSSVNDAGGSHPSGGHRGRHIMEIILAIFESGAYRRPVTLPQAERDHPLLRLRREAGLGAPDPAPREYREWLAVQAARHGWPVERTGKLP